GFGNDTCSTSAQSGHHFNSDCILYSGRSSRARTCRKLEPTRRQHHRHYSPDLRIWKKWLQLLQETAPSVTEFAVLINPTSPNLAEVQTKDLQAAARNLNLRIHLLNASTEDEFETVFAKITELHAGGLVITSDSFFFAHIDKLAALAAQNKV